MALLEWSRGDVSTVSLHTYERCPQMNAGDLRSYIPMLRSDPLSRMALLSLPEDSVAVLPVLQEQTDLDPLQESFSRYASSASSPVMLMAAVMSRTPLQSSSPSRTYLLPSRTSKTFSSCQVSTHPLSPCCTARCIPGPAGIARAETPFVSRSVPSTCHRADLIPS